MTSWWPSRRLVAALAIFTAILTGAGAAVLGGSPSFAYGAGAYVAVVVGALYAPSAILPQVIGGQALAGSLLLAPGGPGPLWLAPIVAGVVATAELLGVAARLDAPVERDPTADLRRTAVGAVVGGTVFGLVAWADRLPGPTGIVAIGLASAACVALAVVLVRNARGPEVGG